MNNTKNTRITKSVQPSILFVKLKKPYNTYYDVLQIVDTNDTVNTSLHNPFNNASYSQYNDPKKIYPIVLHP